MRKWTGTRCALLLLLVLPAGINEFLSGATPLPALLLNPIVLPFVLGFYGAGVVAIRELAVRLKRGWASILLLGMAFSVVLEGLAARTFFSLSPQAGGVLAGYGKWGGVYWVWAFTVTLTEALYTTVLPILLVNRFYPETIGRQLLPGWAFAACIGSFSAFPILVNLLGPPHPAPSLVFGTLVVVLLLFVVALRLPERFSQDWFSWKARGPWALFLAGLALSISLSAATNVLSTWLPPAIDIGVFLALYFGGLTFVIASVRGTRFAPASVLWATGILFGFYPGDVVRMFSGDPFLLPVVGGSIYLFWQAWRSACRAPVDPSDRPPVVTT